MLRGARTSGLGAPLPRTQPTRASSACTIPHTIPGPGELLNQHARTLRILYDAKLANKSHTRRLQHSKKLVGLKMETLLLLW